MGVPGFSWSGAFRAPLGIETLTAATSIFSLAMWPRLFAGRTTARSASSALQSLFHASDAVLCLADASGRVRVITPNAARILGEGSGRAGQVVDKGLDGEVVLRLQHLDDRAVQLRRALAALA